MQKITGLLGDKKYNLPGNTLVKNKKFNLVLEDILLAVFHEIVKWCAGITPVGRVKCCHVQLLRVDLVNTHPRL